MHDASQRFIQTVRLLLAITCAPLVQAEGTNFTGFWKGKCTDAFGVKIKPSGDGLYSVSFCGPGGCDAPGTWAPNTKILSDPAYRVTDDTHIDIKGRPYIKCTTETNPILDYSTMKDGPPHVTVVDQTKGIPDYDKDTCVWRIPNLCHRRRDYPSLARIAKLATMTRCAISPFSSSTS